MLGDGLVSNMLALMELHRVGRSSMSWSKMEGWLVIIVELLLRVVNRTSLMLRCDMSVLLLMAGRRWVDDISSLGDLGVRFLGGLLVTVIMLLLSDVTVRINRDVRVLSSAVAVLRSSVRSSCGRS